MREKSQNYGRGDTEGIKVNRKQMKVSAQRMIHNKLIRWGKEILTISEEKQV